MRTRSRIDRDITVFRPGCRTGQRRAAATRPPQPSKIRMASGAERKLLVGEVSARQAQAPARTFISARRSI